MSHLRFGLLLFILAMAGCSSAPVDTDLNGVSIARRGESLEVTDSAPAAVSDPVVLPAVEISEDTEEADGLIVTPAIEGTANCEVISNAQFEGEVVRLANLSRHGDLISLDEHALLTQIARQHSQEMACLDYFGHTSPTQGSVEERISTTGYEFAAIGEIIASGYESPEEVVSAWLSSTGHRENLLSSDFVHIGVGYARLVGEDQIIFWTVVLASPLK